jgi:hypothetical protein
MEDKDQKEVESVKKENLAGRLEKFAKSPEFKQVFEEGISDHIRYLEEDNQPSEDETPDISEALEIYKDLENVVSTGFGGLVFRNFRYSANRTAHFSLAKKEDLSKENPTYFDFSEETEKREYEVSVNEIARLSAFGRDPAEVVDSGGFQIRVSRKRVRKLGEVGGIEFKGEQGFSVRVNEGGKCVGKGTVQHGRSNYKSESTYEMSHLNREAQNLTGQVKNLKVF